MFSFINLDVTFKEKLEKRMPQRNQQQYQHSSLPINSRSLEPAIHDAWSKRVRSLLHPAIRQQIQEPPPAIVVRNPQKNNRLELAPTFQPPLEAAQQRFAQRQKMLMTSGSSASTKRITREHSHPQQIEGDFSHLLLSHGITNQISMMNQQQLQDAANHHQSMSRSRSRGMSQETKILVADDEEENQMEILPERKIYNPSSPTRLQKNHLRAVEKNNKNDRTEKFASAAVGSWDADVEHQKFHALSEENVEQLNHSNSTHQLTALESLATMSPPPDLPPPGRSHHGA